MIYNLHNRDKYNVGDMVSAPLIYENLDDDFLVAHMHRVVLTGKEKVILGGGGLLNQYFKNQMSLKLDPKNAVVWGAGTNEHDKAEATGVPHWVNEFSLVGVRDSGTQYDYVPCPSCMSGLFDRTYEVQHDVVVFDHGDRPTGIKDLPTMTNFHTTLEKCIQFIGSSETVITSSYHGAYWGMLLNRRVIIVKPFSSKFYAFETPPLFCYGSDWKDAYKQSGAIWGGYLNRCRDANRKFSAKVREMWKI